MSVEQRDPPGHAIGIDTGGTFVDCVVLEAGGHVRATAAKALSTPTAPVEGVLAALAAAARQRGEPLEDLLAATTALVHGTTVGLNALVTRAGGPVGLLATRGHEDAMLIGRVHQKVAGLRPDETTRASALSKPPPLVPRWLVRGIHERTDHAGSEVVALDREGVAAAARELVAAGCRALAVSFLWSFRNDAHERNSAEVVAAACPGVPVSLSSEVAPVLGEYERTAATVVNALVGERFGGYLGELAKALGRLGFGGALYMMLSSGGVAPAATVARRPLEALGSGPAGGIEAARRLGGWVGAGDLVATDVGGTSFDVGLVVGGAPRLAKTPVMERLHLAMHAVDVRSIGAGGGSIAWLDGSGQLHVGPDSAGAEPGPACYGRGGTEPTVTDADLLLGRLNPDARIGGELPPDRAAAERALEPLAKRLDADPVEVAAGIVRVVDARMADLVRAVTVEAGLDPRELTLLAYGGAGPLHVGAYAPDVGAREAIVPAMAPVFSAYGLALADWRRLYARSEPLRLPADPAPLERAFAELERRAAADHQATGLDAPLRVERSADLRYGRQTHEVTVPLDPGPLDEEGLAALIGRFEREYERTFGPGTGYRAAGVELTTIRVVATAARSAVTPAAGPGPGSRGAEPAAPAEPSGTRPVHLGGAVADTPVYQGERLRPGHQLGGPAVVDFPATTLVVHPGQRLRVDDLGNLRLELGTP